MNFTFPSALLLLLLFFPYAIWLGRGSNGRYTPRRWRERVSLGLRLIILLLLILSLAGLQLARAADDLAVVFLLDASDSIRPEQREQAEAFVREAMANMGPNDQAAVIVFGRNALVERPMSGLTELGPITSVPQSLQTNLAEAIRLGMALFPAGNGRRLVILSDGADNLGDATAAARLAATAGVQIDVVPLLRDAPEFEALLTQVDAPTRISQGESFRINVTAESTANMPATLRILSGGGIIHEERVELRRGINNFAVRLQAAGQEFARYRVQLTPDQDTFYQNNELAAFTEITGPPRVLLVAHEDDLADDGTPRLDESPQLRLALEAAGLEVDRVTPTTLSSDLAALSNYASVVLVNVNAKELTERKMLALQSYVRDLGGGLVVVGGPESFGMGGYFQTPLEAALPVEMQIKDQERFPSVSIVIVIDRSGSMGMDEGGLTKIQLAGEAAVRVVELLNDFDEITVLPVDTQVTGPIGPLPAGERDLAIELIRQMGAGGGGIYMRTGLEAAAEALAQSSSQVKHVIVLADGADAEQKEGVPELLDALTAEGVTISMVSIGQGIDTPWLQQMAERGNGRFHLTDRAANLPQIFTQETTAIQRSYLIEERFFPSLVSSSPILAGITAVPPLYGYVGTSPKATAQLILNTHQEDPLLAAWQYGLGRSVAWTSDATGRWGREWVQWSGFPTFWAQAVRWTIDPGRDSSVETNVTLHADSARLTVDARTNGGFLNGAIMTANVVAPDGAVKNLALTQVAPGRYAADFAPDQEGAYFIRVAGESTDGESVVGQTSGWVLGYSPEFQQLGAEPDRLLALAEIGGGRDVTEGITAVFGERLTGERTTRPVWNWLALVAVLLLPFDVAARRLVLTRRDWERVWAATGGRLRQEAPRPEAQTEQVARLFEAKRRAAIPPASTERQTTASAEQPIPGAASAPPDATKPSSRPTPQPAPPPATPPAGTGSLASRLLDKKRQQTGDENSHKD